jgi:hypothetical protein
VWLFVLSQDLKPKDKDLGGIKGVSPQTPTPFCRHIIFPANPLIIRAFFVLKMAVMGVFYFGYVMLSHNCIIIKSKVYNLSTFKI